MKKVLFVDEKQYRFSFYYEPEEWWLEKGIKPYFKAYEKRKDKWLIYLWLLFNRPHAVVFVQLSLKNMILARLSNLFMVRTIFWQHGVFKYNDAVIKKYRKINASLDYLLSLSKYDEKNITLYFKKVKYIYKLSHYDLKSILKSKKIENSILYIGQILTREQLTGSLSSMQVDEDFEKLMDRVWVYLSKSNYKVFLKKHPGDKSLYLENLEKKYTNFHLITSKILPSLIMGHYSTLIIPYLQMGIPFVMIPHRLNKEIDISRYSINKIYSLEDLIYNRIKYTGRNQYDYFEPENVIDISNKIVSLL